MSTDEERISRFLDIFENLTEVAGDKEHTKIVPNCEVIDSSPAGLTGYIIVKNDLGYYIPAVKAPDITYVNGDKVNLLFIKGTEPIAFQHGSSSGTGGYPSGPAIASQAEVDAGTNDTKYITPLKFANTPKPQIVQGRLTLTSNTPVLTSSVTAATTIYFTPYLGNAISIYTGVFWKRYTLSEISIAVPSTVYRLFDIFVYDNAGTLTLETLNWNQSTGSITGATNATPIVITSNGHGLSENDRVAIVNVGGNTAANGIWSVANVLANTFELEGSTGSGAYTSGGTWYKLNETRATAITLQNGVYVKSGATTRLYLGTGMTTDTSGQTEIVLTNPSNILLWNYWNRVEKWLLATDNTNHTYTSSATRIYRNVNTNKLAFVMGIVEDVLMGSLIAEFNFDAGDNTCLTAATLNRSGALEFFTVRTQDVLDARHLADVFAVPSGASNPLHTGYNFVQLLQQGGATSPDFRRGSFRATLNL